MPPDANKRSMTPAPCACTSVRKAARVLARTFDSGLADSGLNITQLAVLRAVLRHPHEPLSRVAEDLAMDRTSLYRALAAMEKQHWVTLRDGSDGRARTAGLTRTGETVLTRADPGWASTQNALIERFGAAQWQTLVAELRRLAECAEALKSAADA